MPEQTYGAKCPLCGCLPHHGLHTSEPIAWLPKPKDRLLWCADCDSCQRHSLHDLLMEAGLGIFDPEVRQAVHAFQCGDDHPLIDRLRDEIQALDNGHAIAPPEADQNGRYQEPTHND